MTPSAEAAASAAVSVVAFAALGFPLGCPNSLTSLTSIREYSQSVADSVHANLPCQGGGGLMRPFSDALSAKQQL